MPLCPFYRADGLGLQSEIGLSKLWYTPHHSPLTTTTTLPHLNDSTLTSEHLADLPI